MLKYEIRFKERGELTDTQKAGLLKKLKLTIVKEKESGSLGIWTVKAKTKLTEEDMAKALKFYKLSREMSNVKITAM
jgi:hypothetical protein